eukprot:jgi/Hompol1/5002/HPOL_004085-RA
MSPNLVPYSQQIIPAVLSNIANTKKRPESMEWSSPSMYTKRRSITDQLITDDELRQSAKTCIVGLYGQANVANLKEFVLTASKFLDEKGLWASTSATLETVQSITAVVQSQYHYVILSLMLERLESEKQPAIKTTVVRVLNFLIADGEGVAGLTIPEMLETFTRHLKKSAAIPATADQTEQLSHKRLQQSLIDAIGSLAFNPAYPNQINDILAFLINRLMADIENPITTTLLLRTLDQVISVYATYNRRRPAEDKRTSIVPTTISFELLTPTLKLIENSTVDARIVYQSFIYKILEFTPHFWKDGPEIHPLSSFYVTLWQKVYAILVSDTILPIDYVNIGRIITTLLKHTASNELYTSIPVLFRLQSHIADNLITSGAHQRALASMIVEYMIFAGDHLAIPDLSQLARDLRQARLDQRRWSPGFDLSDETVESLNVREFSETEAANGGEAYQPANIEETLLSLPKVIDILMSDARFKDTERARARLEAEILVFEVSMPASPVRSNFGESIRLVIPDPLTQNDRPGRRGSSRRSPSMSNNVHASSFRSASQIEKLPAIVRIDDLKDALAEQRHTNNTGKILDTSNIDLTLLESESTGASKENIAALLKSITATLGKAPSNESVELDWLNARLRDAKDLSVSPGEGHKRSYSHLRMQRSDSSSSIKGMRLREPDLIGLDSSDPDL